MTSPSWWSCFGLVSGFGLVSRFGLAPCLELCPSAGEDPRRPPPWPREPPSPFLAPSLRPRRAPRPPPALILRSRSGGSHPRSNSSLFLHPPEKPSLQLAYNLRIRRLLHAPLSDQALCPWLPRSSRLWSQPIPLPVSSFVIVERAAVAPRALSAALFLVLAAILRSGLSGSATTRPMPRWSLPGAASPSPTAVLGAS